jgi:hypothetical protein
LHSPNRVHQLLFRTREWIKKNLLPLEIRESGSQFSVQFGIGVGIRIPFDRTSQSRSVAKINIAETEFSAKDLQIQLKISQTTAARMIQRSIQSGELITLRAGRSIRYKKVA